MDEYKNVVEIRLLPNSTSSFSTKQDFISYLTGRWTKRGGVYYYPTQSIRVAGRTLILFQYNGELVASAVLLESKRHPVFDEDGDAYGGQYIFDPSTLCVFSSPINASVFSLVYPELGSFSQSKRIIPLDRLNGVIELIENAGPIWVNK